MAGTSYQLLLFRQLVAWMMLLCRPYVQLCHACLLLVAGSCLLKSTVLQTCFICQNIWLNGLFRLSTLLVLDVPFWFAYTIVVQRVGLGLLT